MNRRSAVIVLATALVTVTTAKSGHESPIYPSYYPHEIDLAAVAPERAAELLLAGKIQAYLGAAPRFASSPLASIDSVESLGSFIIVRVNPSSPKAKDRQSACAVAELVIRNLAGRGGDVIVHPYPVTPFHGDYLQHVDLADAAKAHALGGANPSDVQDLKVKAGSARARSLIRPEWHTDGSQWDVEVAESDAAALVANASVAMNGWLGPAWLRTGWFHAYILLSDQAGDENMQHRVAVELQRLQTSVYRGAVERINLERSLVAALAGGCHVRVAGYTVKREYFSTIFTAGVENIAYDSIAGLNSPMFIRTVKLKDFPWNGWLALGIHAAPASAWNPVAGFTDDFGRLMWSALGDPAMIPSPYESVWMLNRISDVQSSTRP